jgi:hypothetical protein
MHIDTLNGFVDSAEARRHVSHIHLNSVLFDAACKLEDYSFKSPQRRKERRCDR